MYCPVCGDEVKNQQDLIEHTTKKHTPQEMSDFFSNQASIQPITEVIRGENFTKIYSTNWAINVTQHDIRIDIMNEKREHPAGTIHALPVVQFISESQIVSTPIAAKILWQRLGEAISRFEEVNGEIQIPM